MDPIIEIGLIFISAAVLAYISKLFKQPMIPAYILAGLILVLTGFVEANSLVETISTLGIAFLLFIVGLEIDLKRIKDVGFVSTIGGTIMCVVLFGVGFLAAGLLGFSALSSVYIGLVIAFSSTMIVVKLLSDRAELDTLHGRIILGILLLQDIFAIMALFILSTLDNFSFITLLAVLIVLIAVILVMYLLSKYIFPTIFKYAAKSEELLFVTSVAVCLIFIGLFHYLDLSIAIGAFLAGLTLGNLPYNIEIISLVKPLRDFFSVIFFVSLGMQLDLIAIGTFIIPVIVITLLIIIIKPLLTMVIISLFGYKTRPSFLTSMSLAQASEFSLILLVFGVTVGHITQEIFSSVIFVVIVTMALTAYLFEYEVYFYKKIHKFLKIFERVSERGNLEYIPKKLKTEVVLIGCDRLGYNIFNALSKMKQNFIVVDYNPEIVRDLIKKKIPCLYGDVSDIEILNTLDLKNVKMIISTVPEKESSLLIIKKAKEANPHVTLFLTSMHVEEALDLYDAGADYVILPHFLGGERISLFLQETKGDMNKVFKKKLGHIKELENRKILGHNHSTHQHSKRHVRK